MHKSVHFSLKIMKTLLYESVNFISMAEKLSEDSGTNPVNRYGKQKVEAEKTVLSTDSKNLVIRTSVSIPYLLSKKSRKTVLSTNSKNLVIRTSVSISYLLAGSYQTGETLNSYH